MFGRKKKTNDASSNSKEAKKQAKADKKAARLAEKEAKKEAKRLAKEAKKNAGKADSPDNQGDGSPEYAASKPPSSATKKKRRFFSIKKLIFSLLILLAFGGAGFAVYKLYTKPPNTEAVYVPKQLNHVSLSDEILNFSFYLLPDLYDALVEYNRQVDRLDGEIARIASVGDQYPDQKKIADKEQKVWEKIREKLTAAFDKIQKKIEALFVSFKVNKDEGLIRIGEERDQLLEDAREALAPSFELTSRLPEEENIPEGLVPGTLYKINKEINALKNKFLK